MRIKICGVTREQDARLACELGAWAVGLIFVPGSPRALVLDAARRLRSAIAPPTIAIGVFADAEPDAVSETARALRLDAVQYHGGEAPEACAAAPAPAYKGLPFAAEEDLGLAERYAGRVAGLLLEIVRRTPEGREKVAPAERARRCALAREARRLGPVLLAGELTPGNVAEAVRGARPDGVDVSGGVESAPGVKDASKLRAFFDAVRRAEAA